MVYLISITEVTGNETTEHYRRRVEVPDIQTTIRAIDSALNVKVRKPRRDKGTSRALNLEQALVAGRSLNAEAMATERNKAK
jgi:hypothetical protein